MVGWWALATGCRTTEPSTPTDADTDVVAHSAAIHTGTPGTSPTAETGGSTTTTTGHTGAADTGDDLAYEALFDVSRVHEVVIEVADVDWALALAGTEDELPALLTLDATPLQGGSFRVRGDAALLGLMGKSDLELDLDDGGGQRVGDVERLTLNAQLDDPACAREVLATEVLRAAGLNPPRAVFAHVVLHGEDLGVYTMVEGVDRSFLERRFADPHGDLWEARSGADFSGPGIERWRAVGGSGDRDALDAVRVVVQTSTDFPTELEPLVDLPALFHFWAWVAAVGHTRGWPHRLDDVYAYADPLDADRFVFVPWSMERSFDPTSDWGAVESQLAIRCRYEEPCDTPIRAAVAQAADELELLAVPTLADTVFAVSEAVVIADPARPIPLGEVAAARDQLRALTLAAPAKLRGDLAR